MYYMYVLAFQDSHQITHINPQIKILLSAVFSRGADIDLATLPLAEMSGKYLNGIVSKV